MNQLLAIINDLRTEEAVSESDFNAYVAGHHVTPETIICSLAGVSEEELLAYISEKAKCELITFDNANEYISEQSIKDACQTEVNWDLLAKLSWYPLSLHNDKLSIITNQPLSSEASNLLAFKNVDYQLCLASESLLQRVVTLFEQNQEVISSGVVEVERLRALASEAPIVNLVNSLIHRSLELKASDMHIEPVEQGGRVRIRVDGVLQKLDDIPKSLVMPVVSRIKILANLDIAEKRRPQDGKIALHNLNIDIRASILPLNNGESVVMRFLEKGSLRFDIAELGFEPDTIERINQDLTRTAGVILMTGPTGSGKTTSLYSFLQQLNSSHEKIITLEDPVEYELEGVNQIQVNSDIGFDFAAGLRSIVRQDPDVIMVGEIRDAETARIAMQSSLTGHLVFSTVHTNDAPGAYVRLIDLGVDEFLLNASVISIIAQRLVRKLCEHCSIEDENAAQIKQKLLATHGDIIASDMQINKAVGCEKCNGTGYKGRLALIEYLPNDQFIKGTDKDSSFTLNAENYMKESGLRNLYQDGIVKVAKGLTTIEEVVRVAG
ncbi:Type II secretion system protein E [Pseudoalteromonas sp. P1-9]|uniref:GspE/PulE family protein n=1 Tax=Pseudoalteromonas sp. P1-9 TaxID=1710354 RepID=UPI0006D62B50|nr:GspE/PulE family protein [Pseudoalteromonas sp. P1-9]KPV96732.1 Type II secretion system protein E [Pseudoalteromonas sp. P1-9]